MRLRDEQILFVAALVCLPLMLFLLPLMLAARFGRPKSGVRVALTVSNRWPAYLQFIRLPYDLAILRAGAKVATIAPKHLDDIGRMLDRVDAVVISGGEDVRRETDGDGVYGAGAMSHNPDRDQLELAVLEEAEKRGLPLLCVCRGMQLLALDHGGTLASLDDDPELSVTHKTTLRAFGGHSVEIRRDSRLNSIFNAETIKVNSLHHQHVVDPGGLEVTGRSPDGLVEALELPGERFVVGVQWHPELQAIWEPKEEKLFKALVEAARQKR